jgi:hypothetical protein
MGRSSELTRSTGAASLRSLADAGRDVSGGWRAEKCRLTAIWVFARHTLATSISRVPQKLLRRGDAAFSPIPCFSQLG